MNISAKPVAPYSARRFAIWFERGAFDISGCESLYSWVGQDGNHWVQYKCKTSGASFAHAVAVHNEKY